MTRESRADMLEVVALTYGMLLSFVLSGASQNRKMERANPPILNYIGYLLFGVTCAVAASLTAYAVWSMMGGDAI